jgi:hypothetical protein
MAPRAMKNPDEDHLKILGIFEYVMAGISALAGCCMIGYAFFGVALIAAAFDRGPNAPPAEFGIFFTIVFASIALYAFVYCFLEILTARFLIAHIHYRFCFVMACIELVNFPFGTVLGICIIVALSRPSVRALYDGVPYYDPRLDALEGFEDRAEDDEERRSKAPAAPGDDGVREGTPP